MDSFLVEKAVDFFPSYSIMRQGKERENVFSQNNDDREKKLADRAHENRIVRKIVTIFLLIMIVFVGGLFAGGMIYLTQATKPVNAKDVKTIEVEIPMGSSVSDIANELKKQGAIKSALIFRYYVKYKNETGFQAGNYELTTAMDVEEIISQLKEGKVEKEAELKLTILEGLRLTDIAAIISKNTSHSVEDILTKLEDEEFIESLLSTYPMLDEKAIKQDGIKYALEGYLFPATYEYAEQEPAIEVILISMIEQMQKIINKYADEISESGYSVHEILTLASLIETESQKSEDRFKISGVFHNRLKNDMRLDSDPTVKYALDKTDIQVTYQDTDVSSPYNTYRMKGFPIGPIASPREESIEAALKPEQVSDFYFFARPNGEVIYTKTLSEHEQVVATYREEWNELIRKQREESAE